MTNHRVIIGNSNNLYNIEDRSIDLIVTSPPYPMIEMWDEMFAKQDYSISDDLLNGNGMSAFNKMHNVLSQVWEECDRVLIPNGFICINIGDATRTINDHFQLFSNHTQIINFFLNKNYCVLPDIHWRKQSNSPNKFMGSGMYPAGAYVTYEHEYILIFRKGGKRVFKGKARELRQKSAYFWEERNVWFSDLWEITGTSQAISNSNNTRNRNASFPFEIPYRLVNMYSVEGDTILDPFAGLCTTSLACMAANRNSISVEIDKKIAELALNNLGISVNDLNSIIDTRLQRHLLFIKSLSESQSNKCYINSNHGFKVKTRQETALKISRVSTINIEGHEIQVTYC